MDLCDLFDRRSVFESVIQFGRVRQMIGREAVSKVGCRQKSKCAMHFLV